MSRMVSLIALTLCVGFGAAACHGGGPGGDMPQDPMGGPMMYRAPAISATACSSQAPAAPSCSPVER